MKLIRNYIRDLSRVFSLSIDDRMLMLNVKRKITSNRFVKLYLKLT